MARIRTALAAAPVAVALLLAGAGVAAADSGSFADHHSNGSVVSNSGSGNLSGLVDGNALWSQQTATGAGAHNSNNTVAVKGSNNVTNTDQKNTDISFGPIG
jgi:hypothetical protein